MIQGILNSIVQGSKFPVMESLMVLRGLMRVMDKTKFPTTLNKNDDKYPQNNVRVPTTVSRDPCL